jgi:hypothetical protein
MILRIQLDVTYLSESQARNSLCRRFYKGIEGSEDDTSNGAILATTNIMKAVMSSASEAEI